ncbi:MAG: CotH kinase family protein [Flavobacteriaceae bacterium]|nr:CotH kinase family protein [Flavobacteriaceae bacterium]
MNSLKKVVDAPSIRNNDPYTWIILGMLFFMACDEEDLFSDSKTSQKDYYEVVAANEIGSLPHIYIDTDGKEIVDEPKIPATFEIQKNQEVIEKHFIGIEIRGASSQFLEKKSYGFETWDEQGKDLNVGLAGYPEEEDWILHGPYIDKTLIRNVLMYDLSNQIGRYATKTSFYDVTINSQYLGVYVLMEKIKRDKNRVDIKKVKDDDITGGYIIKIDKTNNDEIKFIGELGWKSKYTPWGVLRDEISQRDIHFLYEYPDADDIKQEQKQYIQNYFEDFEKVLMSDEFKDAEIGYRQYIDVDSFVDYLLLNELSRNIDAYRISTYMYKENKNGKLFMGPIWDFNLAFGNADYCRAESTTGWSFEFNSVCPQDHWLVPFWWSRLLSDPYFAGKVRQRWKELRSSVFSFQAISKRIDTNYRYIKSHGGFRKNFTRWKILGKRIQPNFYVGNNHHEEYQYLKEWILKRTLWMDSAIENL